MGKKFKRSYDEETGKSIVYIFDKGKRYKGVAKVLEEDSDMKSRLVGLTIAETKAEIKRETSKSKADLAKIQKLKNEIAFIEKRAAERKDLISFFERFLKDYIEVKATFAKSLRKLRTKRKEMENDESNT